jgi:predicted regulator of Ras-like GTPase activity (Roadblock/LC7/MglB family)
LFAAGFEETGDALLVALDGEQDLVALSPADREAILQVLDDPPFALGELRAVLLAADE